MTATSAGTTGTGPARTRARVTRRIVRLVVVLAVLACAGLAVVAHLQGGTAEQVTAVIPHLDALVQTLRTPPFSHALGYGVTALLAGWLLLIIWAPRRTDESSRP